MSMPQTITDTELALFSEYIRAISGIQIDASKKYLLTTRLDDLVAAHGTYTALWNAARNDPTRSLEKKIIDAVSTNETFFFRDPKTFDMLRYHFIPGFFGDPSRTSLSIWSAAASTGQEAYSTSIVLKELLFDLTGYRLKIYGTDISPAAVDTANKGEFTRYELNRGLDQKQISHYFAPSGERFRISDELRSICRFQVDNLLTPKTLLESFDIIFCRNVLIYFSLNDRQKVYTMLHRHLKKGGILILGGTETLMHETDLFKREEYRGATYYTVAIK
jgi:chemotaxis protein methyltransferase CheR